MLRLARVMPLRVLLSFAAGLGTIAFYVSKRYRLVGLKNLKLAYGSDLTEKQRQKIVRNVFVNFAKSFVAEFPWTVTASDNEICALAEASPQDIKRLLSYLDDGKGAILVTAHFGNFELLTRRVAVEGPKLAAVVRNDSNQALAEIINSVRQYSYETIERGSAARKMLQRLRENYFVAIAPDQKSHELLLPFFGQPTGTVAGPARLALKSGARIIPFFCVRQANDRHKIIIGPEIDTRMTGDREADVERIMTDVNQAIETMIRQYPDQWLWLHDRWRNAPELIEQWQRKLQSEPAAAGSP